MRYFLMLIAVLLVSGCVTATYTATSVDGTAEKFTLRTWGKSVDGLSTQKGNGVFWMKFDKSDSQDPMAQIAQMMQMMQMMQTYQMVPPPVDP
jgi:hypothetical protein